MIAVARVFMFSVYVAFALALLLVSTHAQQIMGQETELDRYKASVSQNPDDAEAHKKLGIAYAKNEMFDEATDELEKAMKIEYERGKQDAIRREKVRIFGVYLILSIALGLLVAAAVVSIVAWTEIADGLKVMRKNARIRAFINGVGVRLAPELRDRALEIAQRREKLRDAISREADSNLKEAASAILPRLDDLAKQASLLLELEQNLSDYIKDIDPIKLEMVHRDCEEKLRKETDQEAKEALEYQLKQIRNKRTNYSKAKAKIRTCDAVLNGIVARIDATSLDLMSLPSVMIKKQEFFEKVSAELDEEIRLTRNAAETVMGESSA